MKPLPPASASPAQARGWRRGAEPLLSSQMVTRQFNVNPDNTTFGGNCSATLATLELHDSNLLLLVLQFSMVRPLSPSWSAGPLAPQPSSISRTLAALVVLQGLG